jgi:hypothetical protein
MCGKNCIFQTKSRESMPDIFARKSEEGLLPYCRSGAKSEGYKWLGPLVNTISCKHMGEWRHSSTNILNLAFWWGWMVGFMPHLLFCQKPLYRRLGGPQSLKKPCLTSMWTLVVQTAAYWCSKSWLIQNSVIQNFVIIQILILNYIQRRKNSYKFAWLFQKLS